MRTPRHTKTKANTKADADSAVIDGLLAKHAEFVAKAANIAATLAEAYGVSIDQPSETVTPKFTARRTSPRIKAKLKAAAAVDALYAGLSLQEAARKRLSLVEPKNAQSQKELWVSLENAGFKSASERPVHAVGWALRKRQKSHKDVMLVGGGKWGLTSWYTAVERAEITRKLGGMAGREINNHSDKTRLGMKLAKARGVHTGRKPKMTPEVIEAAETMLLAGMKAADVAVTLGVSKAAIYSRLTVGHREGKLVVGRKDPAWSNDANDKSNPRVAGGIVH